MKKEAIIGVVGAGAMGTGIAQVGASAGHKVILFDSNTAAIEKSKNVLNDSMKKLVDKGKISVGDAKNILDGIHFVAHLSEFKNCGLIIEAIVENYEVKKSLFSELEKNVKEDCILATNTSSLSVTAIAGACIRQERVVGIHFFNPAPMMPLVEIVPGASTKPSLATNIKALMEDWKKIPVIAKDTPGFIVNRVARPFYVEAIRIYEEGFSDFATIDSAMKEIGGFKMGPFELMDLIGNDVNYAVTETIWKQFFFDPKYKPSRTQKRLVESGLLGRKSGKGYYDYPATSGMSNPSPTKGKMEKQDIFFRVLVMLINEASDALYYGVAEKEDIDLAMMKGVNYPKGLLRWADEIGIPKVITGLEKLYSEYGEDRYRPSVLLKKMEKEGKNKFYI